MGSVCRFNAFGTITEALRVELVTVAEKQASVFGDVQLGVDVLADDLMWDVSAPGRRQWGVQHLGHLRRCCMCLIRGAAPSGFQRLEVDDTLAVRFCSKHHRPGYPGEPLFESRDLDAQVCKEDPLIKEGASEEEPEVRVMHEDGKSAPGGASGILGSGNILNTKVTQSLQGILAVNKTSWNSTRNAVVNFRVNTDGASDPRGWQHPSATTAAQRCDRTRFSIVWDPLDGSSIVDNNWAVGTILGTPADGRRSCVQNFKSCSVGMVVARIAPATPGCENPSPKKRPPPAATGIWDAKKTGILGATGRDQASPLCLVVDCRNSVRMPVNI